MVNFKVGLMSCFGAKVFNGQRYLANGHISLHIGIFNIVHERVLLTQKGWPVQL